MARSVFPIVITDRKDRVLRTNARACALLGMSDLGDGWERFDPEVGEPERDAVDVRWHERLGSDEGTWFQLDLRAAGADADQPPTRVWARLESEGTATLTDGPLSKRERDVLGFVATGLHTSEIAEELGLSPETVKSHVHNAMMKLRAHTRSQAVAIALATGQVVYGGHSVAGN